MLLLLIPVAWLVLVLLVLAVCRSSASEEASAERAAGERPGVAVAMPGLTVWDCPDEQALVPVGLALTSDERPATLAATGPGRRPHRVRRPVAGATRGARRRGRFAARS
jgi:hypothetical protein